MQPAPPARRPRPGPGTPAPAEPDAIRPGLVVVVGDETIRAPGLWAVLRRNPRTRRHGAVGAIAAGVALFATAAFTAPLAGADSASAPRPVPVAPTLPAAAPPVPLANDPAAPAVHKVLRHDPAHVAEKAPVGHGVISGLAANGIPSVALNAYRVAAARMAGVQPECGIDWALLAGIGREESDHGRFAGAVLHADGISTPAIIGPALDGVHWDYIPAPGNGPALDGDARFAHALGPMQFIPSTWSAYGADATGDGRADIFNINDAALGTARYLCAAGGNLRTRAGQVAGVLAYNHSDQYLAQVLALADAYRSGVRVTGTPVGITKGALPGVNDTGYIPPANPGAPTAVDRQITTKHRTSARPKTGTSSTPTAKPATGATSATRRPAPTSGTSASSTAAKPAPSPTRSSSTPSPTPSPTKTCSPLEVVLGCRPS